MDRHRFDALWRRAGGGLDSHQLFDLLTDHYQEAHRHYHNGHHIVACLQAYDNAAVAIGADDAVEMALWFHDAIYTPGASDNEARSVAWFQELAAGQLSGSFISEVSHLIMATCHTDLPVVSAAKFVVDVDLWGLGQAWEGFFADTTAIRREASQLTNEDFARGQRKFFEPILQRAHIYFTSHFQHHLDGAARDNIQHLLAHLDSKVAWQ